MQGEPETGQIDGKCLLEDKNQDGVNSNIYSSANQYG